MMRPLFHMFLFCCATTAHAQSVLFTEDFEGVEPAFSLNTDHVGSTISGPNMWMVNDVYAGGDGEIECLGFPFAFSVPNTANQPAGITTANGKYVHITSVAAVASGVQNCCFSAADDLCTAEGNHFASMSADVSTLGQSDVSLSFWWLCAGGTNSFGEVYHSTDGGVTWTLINTPMAHYRDQETWVQQTITSPNFVGHAQLRFGFRFVNGVSLNAADPGFGVDDVRITATTATQAIATGVIEPLSHCQDAAIEVPFFTTGTFDSGNVFTAELSDANGSFATPVVVGSLVGGSSGTISGIIPAGTAVGTGYQIRVVSSTPPVQGSVSTSDVSVVEAPNAGADVELGHCTTDAAPNLYTMVSGGDDGGEFYYQGLQLLPDLSVPDEYVVLYVVEGLAGCPADTAAFYIEAVEAPNAGTGVSITVCANDGPFNLFELLTGSPQQAGAWSTPQGELHSGLFNPASDAPGLYTYEVLGLPPCEADRAFVAIAIDPCAGIAEHTTSPLRWLGQVAGHHLFQVPLTMQLTRLQVWDASGRQMDVRGNLALQGNRLRIDLGTNPAGIYMVQLPGLPAVRLVHMRP